MEKTNDKSVKKNKGGRPKEHINPLLRFKQVNERIDIDQRDIRILIRRVEKCELREKQIIILFKKLLDTLVRRKGCDMPLRIREIVEYMELLVKQELPEDGELDSKTPNLLDEILRDE